MASIDGAAFILGPRVFGARKFGALWIEIDTGGVVVAANSNQNIVGIQDERIHVGELWNGGIRWTGGFDARAGETPTAIRASGERVVVTTSQAQRGLGLVPMRVHTSTNGGRTWKHAITEDVTAAYKIDLYPNGSGVGVTWLGEIVNCVPRFQ